MKSTPTKLFATTLAIMLVIFLISSFRPSDAGSKYLTLRTWETFDKMIVIYEDGKTEEFALDKFTAKNFVAVSLKVNQTINNIASKGYELVSSTGGDNITTYIFQKK
jgi:hypothetical protein